MKKKEKINSIFDEIVTFAEEREFPYKNHIAELREKYDLECIVGLLENFLKDPYLHNQLEAYCNSELDKYNSLCGMFGFAEVHLNDNDKAYLLEKITDLCKIIF